MKKIIALSVLVIPILAQAQVASRLLPSQSNPQPINAPNIVWVDTVAGGQQRIWVADRDSLKLYTYQIKGLKDSVEDWGDQRYPMLTEVYYNPSFVGSIAANKVTGLNEFMIRSALGYKPADSANTITINGSAKTIGSNPVFIVSGTDTTSLSNRINQKFTIPTGTTSQYLRGDGTPLAFPSIPAQVNINSGSNIKITGTYPNLTISDSSHIAFYNSAGRVNQTVFKIWADIVTPTTGNGYSIDISSAGFTNILSVYIGSETNQNSTGSMRNVELKSFTTTSAVSNIALPNSTYISLLNLTLLGVPTFIGSGTGTKLHITVIGY